VKGYHLFGLLAFSLSGCASRLPAVNAIPQDRIDQVLSRIKEEVSVYESKVNSYRQYPETDTALIGARKQGLKCGKGLIDFDLVSVQATLTTTASLSGGGSFGFSIPVVSPAGTIGPTFTGSHQVDNTQELTFSVFPSPIKKDFSYDTDGKKSVIEDTLLALRESFLRTAAKPGACYYDYNYRDPKSDKGDTYKFGLTVTDDGTADVSIKLAPLTAGLSGEAKSITGNTLLVTFQQTGTRSGNPDIGAAAHGPRRRHTAPGVKENKN
jgi:hypothetical protein